MTIKEYIQYKKQIDEQTKALKTKYLEQIKSLEIKCVDEVQSLQTELANVSKDVKCNVPFGFVFEAISKAHPNVSKKIDILAPSYYISSDPKKTIKRVIQNWGDGNATIEIKCIDSDTNKTISTFKTSIDMQTKLFDDNYFVDLLKITNDRYGVLSLTMSPENIDKIVLDMSPTSDNFKKLSKLNVVDEFLEVIEINNSNNNNKNKNQSDNDVRLKA